MLNPAHLFEIAMLLLAAFLCGAVIGSLARLVALRLVRPKTAPSAGDATSATTDTAPLVVETSALVAAPVIGEVVKTPTPAAPADVPSPDFTEVLLALAGDKSGAPAPAIRMPRLAPLPDVPVAKPAEQMAPARVAGTTTSGRAVAHPRAVAMTVQASPAAASSAEVIPFPVEKAAADPEQTHPGIEVRSARAAVAEVAIPADQAVGPASADQAAEEMTPPLAAVLETVRDAVQRDLVDGPMPSDMPREKEAGLPSPDIAAEEALAPSSSPEAEPEPAADENLLAVAPLSPAEDDEAAAMRAIEGNWSPRRASLGKARRAELPEIAPDEAVLASGAAVSSAAKAAKLAVAAEGHEPPGKPEGLAGPRLGTKDDLTHVIGILPIIETALNRLGLYHFDQLANLSDENAAWIETHLGIAGRIGREHWREQAREIAAAMASEKKVAGS